MFKIYDPFSSLKRELCKGRHFCWLCLLMYSPALRTEFGTKYGLNNYFLKEYIVEYPVTGSMAWKNNSSLNNNNHNHFEGAFYVLSASRVRPPKQRKSRKVKLLPRATHLVRDRARIWRCRHSGYRAHILFFF